MSLKRKMNTFTSLLEPIRDLGWRPGGIIDIGVELGTPGLYSVWPGVPICLIEPSPESMPYMQQIAATYPNVSIFNVGASDGSREIVASKHQDKVNIFFGGKANWESKVVNVRRCDDIIAETDLKPPFIYKLDTDSHELEILRGSPDTLSKSDMCVIELNVYYGLFGMATPNQIWSIMMDYGFTLFNVANCGFSTAGIMRSADLAFVRQDSELFKLASENTEKAQRPVDMSKARL